MQKKRISFDLLVFESLESLSVEDRALMITAMEARSNAYAPYSNFYVGAAVLMGNGAIVIGNNQENACYPSGLCAERVAIYQAGALYPNVPVISIAISAASKNYSVGQPAAPCGNCRQAISEYEIKQEGPIAILMMGEFGQVIKCTSVGDILPLAFSKSFLG
tara:strand:+ start:4731 stop:5216 length:486 start_codon:yes stop_codon:yes gene_type:complete